MEEETSPPESTPSAESPKSTKKKPVLPSLHVPSTSSSSSSSPSQPDDCSTPRLLFDRYALDRLLGEGTFAKVHLAKHLPTGEPVAIKILRKDQIVREGMMEQILREVSVLRLVRHHHVVQLREVMATRSRIFLVMEYVRGGELFAKVSKGRLHEDVARRYFQQLLSAVEFCHSRGVAHRDLKPENLLLDEHGELKVSDFGLSALPAQLWKDGLLHTQCGTPTYVAPEVLRNRGYDGALADLWSCGVILYVLLAGCLPFQDDNVMHIYRKIFNADYKLPPWLSPEASSLISRLLDPNTKKRITIPQIKEDPWFKIGLSENSTTTHMLLPASPPPTRTETHGSKGPTFYNAFELMTTISSGLDLSGMFENKKKVDTVFTSRLVAREIVDRLEKVGRELHFEVSRIEQYKVRMERLDDGLKGRLVVTAEVFEVVPGVEVVEFCHLEGDEMEYERFWEEGIHPRMDDVVWTWHG